MVLEAFATSPGYGLALAAEVLATKAFEDPTPSAREDVTTVADYVTTSVDASLSLCYKMSP